MREGGELPALHGLGRTFLAPYRRAALWTLVAATGGGVLAGVAQSARLTTGLAPYGADAFAAPILALALVRALGPHLALLSTAVTSTVVLLRGEPPVAVGSWRGAAVLGAVVPIAYGPVVLGGAMGAAAFLGATGIPVGVREGFLRPEDYAYGVGSAAARGVGLALLWPAWASYAGRHEGLATKILLGIFGALVLSFVIDVMLFTVIEASGPP